MKIDNDKEMLMEAYNRFYIALNEMFTGNIEKMLKIWSHSDDVLYMGPDNVFLRGWNDICQQWQAQAEKKMGGKVVAKDMKMIIGDNMAITNNYEVGENIDEDGKIVKVSIRATNVFRKEDKEWKMIAHHTDLLPFLID